MSFQKVEAGRGIEWLKQSVELVLKNPVAFLVMSLIIVVIAIIPILGSLALLIIGPALFAGMVYAFREEDQGRKADIGMLFRGFQEPGRIGPLIALCIPTVIAVVIAIVLGFLLVGGALLGIAGASGVGASGASIGAGLGGGILLFMLLMFLIMLVVYALIIYAIPRVMFDGMEPFAAMKESISASLANIVPLLVYCVVMFVIVLVLGFILAFIPFIGPLILMVALYAVSGAFIYVSYRDVFGAGAPSVDAPPPAPVV